MNGILFTFALTFAALAFSCSSVERSRALGDPNVPAKTIALQVCSNCHGVDGNSTSPNFPKLAAQQAPYFIERMKSFRSHHRSDPVDFEYMWGLSSKLTDEQIERLAAYYASQLPVQAQSNDQKVSTAGRDIFENGIAAKGVPPCVACHGMKGEGNQQYPRLAGQHADYLVKQLRTLRRTEGRPETNVMRDIANALTEENMKSVSVYLQMLPPA